MSSSHPLADIVYRVVDVETTGLDARADRVVEIATVDLDVRSGALLRPLSRLVNPGRRIPPAAQAIHGIGDEMVTDAPTLEAVLGDFHDERVVYVAHNAAFDSRFLSTLPGPWLCTVRLARRVFPEAPGYANQVLQEWRGIGSLPEWTAELAAHRALYDAAVTALLLRDMLSRLLSAPDCPESLEALLDYTRRPIAPRTIRFGKHKGKRFDELPTSYLRWMAEVDDWGSDVALAVRNALASRERPPSD